MEVSWNSGTPKSSILVGVFPYKPSILGYPHYGPHLWKAPFSVCMNPQQNNMTCPCHGHSATCRRTQVHPLPKRRASVTKELLMGEVFLDTLVTCSAPFLMERCGFICWSNLRCMCVLSQVHRFVPTFVDVSVTTACPWSWCSWWNIDWLCHTTCWRPQRHWPGILVPKSESMGIPSGDGKCVNYKWESVKL